MKTLHVHFFGCSITAGDELSDEKWFPWKFTEQHDAQSYYKKRNSIEFDWIAYQEENKQQAYPALIEQIDSNVKTYNHSENGKSQRHNILDLLKLVEESTQEIVDIIYFQITPQGRDMIIGETHIIDIIESWHSDQTKKYVEGKLAIARLENQTLQDSMDMYMLTGYLKSKNIPFYFINMGPELELREKDIQATDFNFLTLKNLSNIIDLTDIHKKYNRLLGLHLRPEQHRAIAEFIVEHLKEITSKY